MAELGIEPAELTLLHVLNYGSCNSAETLPQRALGPDYTPFANHLTLGESQAALQSCFEKDWLRVIDQNAIDGIHADLRERNVLGPVYGMPDVGNVDFTPNGVLLMQKLARPEPQSAAWFSSFAYPDIVQSNSIRYFRSIRIADEEIKTLSEDEEVASIQGPSPIGPWRLQWWRFFDSGWQIEIERRRKFSGMCGSMTNMPCMFHDEHWRKDTNRLLEILRRHDITKADWVILAEACDDSLKPDKWTFKIFAERKDWPFGFSVTVEESEAAYQRCLERGWIAVNGPMVAYPIDRFISTVPVLTPFAHRNVPEMGETSVTVRGVEIFRAIAEELSGPDWEDEVWVEIELQRVEHHYCETLDGLDRKLQEHARDQIAVQSVRIETLGPWCVHWWKTFPAGYRMELRIEHDVRS